MRIQHLFVFYVPVLRSSRLRAPAVLSITLMVCDHSIGCGIRTVSFFHLRSISLPPLDFRRSLVLTLLILPPRCLAHSCSFSACSYSRSRPYPHSSQYFSASLPNSTWSFLPNLFGSSLCSRNCSIRYAELQLT